MRQKSGPQETSCEATGLTREMRDSASPALDNCRLPHGADVADLRSKRAAELCVNPAEKQKTG